MHSTEMPRSSQRAALWIFETSSYESAAFCDAGVWVAGSFWESAKAFNEIAAPHSHFPEAQEKAG
jgi:hypothetical protein